MKRNVKKMSGLMMVGVMAICSVSGCGKEDSGEEQSDARQEESSDESAADALTICNINNLVTESFLEAFHEAYPEVQLKVNAYAGMNGSGVALYTLENGDIADIYLSTQNFSEEGQQKYLLNLSGYDFVNNYSNALLDSVDVDGGIYLLPSGYQLTGIYYNKTILEENGWAVPESFEELEALSEEIEAKGYRTMGHGMNLDGFPFNYFFNIGNTVYFGTPEGTVWKDEFSAGAAKAAENSGVRESAEYFSRWVEDGFITGDHMDTDQFLNGECVFYLCLGLGKYENTTADGKTYEFGIMPWLSADGSNNMLTRNVTGYLGINQALAEEGNEQKLEAALKLLEFTSTAEGQQAFMAGNGYYMSSLNETEPAKDSPYAEVADLVSEGRTVPLLYVGWEKLIIPIAQDIKQMIEGDIDADGLLELFDQTNEGVQNDASDDVAGIAKERLTLEKTAELVAIAEGKAVGADCAMVSLNESRGSTEVYGYGVAWYIYEGKVSTEIINMVRPRAGTISVLELTGARIREMMDGGVVTEGSSEPYEYRLYTKGGIELEDAQTYKLAISTGELTGEWLADATETESSPAEAIMEYVKELGTFGADDIGWE